MWMQGSTYSQPRHYEEVGWLVLRSATLTPGEIPRYSFYRRLSEPQDQSGHEGVKKNLHPSDTRDRTRAVQPVAKRLAACATWSIPSQRFQFLFPAFSGSIGSGTGSEILKKIEIKVEG